MQHSLDVGSLIFCCPSLLHCQLRYELWFYTYMAPFLCPSTPPLILRPLRCGATDARPQVCTSAQICACLWKVWVDWGQDWSRDRQRVGGGCTGGLKVAYVRWSMWAEEEKCNIPVIAEQLNAYRTNITLPFTLWIDDTYCSNRDALKVAFKSNLWLSLSSPVWPLSLCLPHVCMLLIERMPFLCGTCARLTTEPGPTLKN